MNCGVRRWANQMETLVSGRNYTIAHRFDKALRLIRNALVESELTVAGEFDASGLLEHDGRKAERSRILLIDSPLLDFEALALDRAAGVFLPLHLLVSADGELTQAFAANPVALFDGRLPLGAAGPMGRLGARVALALESVLLEDHTNRRQPEDEG